MAWVEQRQAGVVAADGGLDAVEHPLGQLVAADVVPGDLEHAAVHGQVVVPGGDHQVDPLDEPVVVHPVVVEERAARRFGDADAFAGG